ncbi:hypothetical protein ScPMuIL_002561 [Solemya velum]
MVERVGVGTDPEESTPPTHLLREEGDQAAVAPPGHRRPHAAAPVHVPSHGRRSFSLDGSSTLIRLFRPLFGRTSLGAVDVHR